MNNNKTLQNTLNHIDLWESQLANYTFEQLLKKPDAESWSLGQVYIHLINATLGFHLKQAEICLGSNENQSKRKNFKGIMTYHILGAIPPIKIKVPPSDAYTPQQPESIAQIKDGLNAVKKEMRHVLTLLDKPQYKGKTPHPGFSFLNANEWYKLVDMHFKHHFRQKSRIDNFLNNG